MLRLSFGLAVLAWHLQVVSDSLPIKALGTLGILVVMACR